MRERPTATWALAWVAQPTVADDAHHTDGVIWVAWQKEQGRLASFARQKANLGSTRKTVAYHT